MQNIRQVFASADGIRRQHLIDNRIATNDGVTYAIVFALEMECSMTWMEIVYIKPYQPRKKKHALCSLYRNAKTYVHTTVNGRGKVSRLIGKGR